MNKLIRFLFPVMFGAGVLSHYYVYGDRLVNISFYLTVIGITGSLIITIKRFGFRRLKVLLSIWAIAFLSLFLFYTGDGMSSLGWAFLAYPSIILGSILIIVYSFRNAK